MALDIPSRIYFAYAFECRYFPKAPRINGRLDDWYPEYLVPDLSIMEGRPKVAEVYMGWNEDGLYFAVKVKKRQPVRSYFDRYWAGDSLQVWLDMRDLKSSRRASRYCHQFNCLPTGGGANKDEPIVKPSQVDRSRERWTMPDPEILTIASIISDSGYSIELFLPKEVLNGYDPVEFPRLGFTYFLNNSEWPTQWWSAGRDLRVHIDPSTWGTAVLSK